MRYIFSLIIFISVFLQGVTIIPFFLVLLEVFYILKKDLFVFPLAFFTGIVTDIVLVRPFGQISLLLVIFLFLLALYEKKFEIKTVPFVAIASFMGSISFFAVIGQTAMWESAVVTSLATIIMFFAVSFLFPKKINQSYL